MCVLCWKEQGPLKDRCREGWDTACLFLLQSSLPRQALRNLWPSGPERKGPDSTFHHYQFHDSSELPWFAQAVWAILPWKIIPGDHYKTCSIAGIWPGDISGSHVLRCLIGDVLLKRKSNYMLKTPGESFGLAKLSLYLHTNFLLEDTRARKGEGCEGQCEKNLMHGLTCNNYLWEDTVIYIECICQYYGHHLEHLRSILHTTSLWRQHCCLSLIFYSLRIHVLVYIRLPGLYSSTQKKEDMVTYNLNWVLLKEGFVKPALGYDETLSSLWWGHCILRVVHVYPHLSLNPVHELWTSWVCEAQATNPRRMGTASFQASRHCTWIAAFCGTG